MQTEINKNSVHRLATVNSEYSITFYSIY